MEQPRISIIIPTLNQAAYIEAAIVSVLQQKYANLELIVIDGASQDGTAEVVNRYKTQIAHFISEKDSGQTSAINKGIKLATGDIITWLNSDDYYEPGILEAIVPMFRQDENVGMVHGKARIFGRGRKTEIVGPDRDLRPHEYLSYMRVPQPACFFSAKAVQFAAPLNEGLHFAMDFELTARVVLGGFKTIRTDRVMAGYRFHENSKSNLNHKFLSEWTQEVHDIFCTLPGAHSLAVETELLFRLPPRPRSVYQCRIAPSKDDLAEVFLQHVDLHFHYAYRELDKPEVLRLAAYLQQKHPGFYRQMKYERYIRRLKIVPTFILELLRKFTR